MTPKAAGECDRLIEYVEPIVIYDNPMPQVHSRHGYHPGIAELPNGDLISLFLLAEAFEAPNGTTYVSRSRDRGRTWQLQGPLYDKSVLGFETTDTMKPCALRDGTIVATGYRFHRHNLEEGIAIPDVGGFQPGDNIVSFSNDGGYQWSEPECIRRSRPELLELSGACVETASGDLVATAGFYNLPDGSNPSGKFGAFLRSSDKGKTWDDRTLFVDNSFNITPWETRVCEMQPGRLVAVIWAYVSEHQRHLTNRVTVSHDNGRSWSPLIDTGHMGQASSLHYLGGEFLLSIHAHRAEDPGIYVRVVEFSHDQWRVIGETVIWEGAGRQTREGQEMSKMFTSLRFGQPSIMRLSSGDFLASHWSIEEGQGKIRAHRLKIDTRKLGL